MPKSPNFGRIQVLSSKRFLSSAMEKIFAERFSDGEFCRSSNDKAGLIFTTCNQFCRGKRLAPNLPDTKRRTESPHICTIQEHPYPISMHHTGEPRHGPTIPAAKGSQGSKIFETNKGSGKPPSKGRLDASNVLVSASSA